MIKKFIHRHSNRFLSRWLVFVFDVIIVSFAYVLALLIRYNFDISEIPLTLTYLKPLVVAFAYSIGFLLSQSYVGVIRHTSFRDAYNVFQASLFGLAILLMASVAYRVAPLARELFFVPNSILFIHFLLSLFFLIGFRVMIKALYAKVKADDTEKAKRVMIFGAGSFGLITKNTLLGETKQDYQVMGFIDDNPYKIGKTIEGIKVYAREKALDTAFVERYKPDQIIIAVQHGLSTQRRKAIVEKCLDLGIRVKVVPPVDKWIHGELSAKQIKAVRIEDLLERDPIVLDNVNIRREIEGRRILVTGAAGSIGSEIARQLLHYKPEKVYLLDQAESPLYELEFEIKSNTPHLFGLCELIMGDVTDIDRMERVFSAFQPHIVFHAAAYKHVPMMEHNPYEAISVNILGTKNVADMAVNTGVEKFVMVSTDKAVNPTNVMGATKRAAEIYTQSLGGRPSVRTQFITTRFGNVLGSNGSVIPLFRRQIEKGGPITVTHKDITRYFMTIPEACNLVLEAGAMGNGGEIFVFDMGESVKIYDLAKKMVKLSGLKLDRDIEIVEVGLRPGEKLYEELLAVKENTKETHHPKILIAETEKKPYTFITDKITEIRAARQSCENMEIVKVLKEIVPEFVSKNSVYSTLDLKKVSSND